MTLATFSSGPSSSSSSLDEPQIRFRRNVQQQEQFQDEDSYDIGSSSSSRKPITATEEPRTWRKRPQHYRRASQPVNSELLQSRRSRKLLLNEDSGSALDDIHSSSDGEEDWELRQRQDRLDYLDLSISLPYALVSLRDHLLAYTSQLEERVRSYYPFHAALESSSSKPDSSLPAVFYAHLDALKEELRALVSALPSPSNAISAKKDSLVHDWERISSTLHTTLAMRPDFPLALPKGAQEHAKALANELPSLPILSPLADLNFAAFWSPLTNGLPKAQGSILITIQKRFETLQDAVRAMTLGDLLFHAKSEKNATPSQNGQQPVTRTRRQSLIASQQALTAQLEVIFDSVRAKGEEVRSMGHARATSIAKAAREAEEHIYAKAVELAKNGQRLIRYDQLPELWKNNEHILSGYRFIPKDEWSSLLKSTFQIHNETGNIMTHLIGALIVTALFWPSKDRYDDQTTPMDRMVQTIYLIAALKCLVLSVSWHVMAGCSDACLFERFACVDYTGIAWLVAASVWTLVYNAFYCQPNLAMVYSLSTLVVGLVGAIVPWQAWFNDRRNKPIRIAVFLAMCFTGLAPFTHALLSHGFYKTVGFFGAIVPSCLAYIFGLVFYATQFPECIYPGRFDVVGHAHQIWHISIVVAILLHHQTTFFWHQNRFNFSCSAVMPETTPLLSNPLAIDLNLADEMVHGWRIVAGRIGDGLVGRIWDRGVEAIMSTF